MLMTRIVFPALLLAGFLAWADEPNLSQLGARLDEAKARLALTEEQLAQVKPIIEEHVKTQLAVLDKYGIDIEARDDRKQLGFRKRRALRKDLENNKDKTVEKLAGILSAAQLAEFKKIQAEVRDQLRKALRSD